MPPPDSGSALSRARGVWHARRIFALCSRWLRRCGLVFCVGGFAPFASAGVLGKAPDVIVCAAADPTGVLPWQQLAFYVSAQLRDGRILYKSLTSPPLLLSVDAQGLVHADNLADCDGRNTDELQALGRALHWPAMTLQP